MLKVMLIEDDPEFIYLMQRYARASGCQLIHPASASQAVRVAESERPELVLLDITPGEHDSRAVLASLKAGRATCHIPLYLCSASEAALREWEHQAEGCLLKPVMYEDFLAILTKVSTQVRPPQKGGSAVEGGEAGEKHATESFRVISSTA
jgi:CheY-like chemotaxis protein